VPPGTASEVQQLSLLPGPQSTWPGAPPMQLCGTQVPPEQTSPEAHAVELCHTPFASQSCGVFPEHCFVPGTQLPLHAPLEQTYGHVLPLCQTPLASQVCGTRPAHCFASGVQTPEHCPPPHT
jgi:hypothetical protein